MDLSDADITAAADLAGQAYLALGLIRGERQWRRAIRLLRPLVYRSARRTSKANGALILLDRAVSRQRAGLLTYAIDAHVVPVQLMGPMGNSAGSDVISIRRA